MTACPERTSTELIRRREKLAQQEGAGDAVPARLPLGDSGQICCSEPTVRPLMLLRSKKPSPSSVRWPPPPMRHSVQRSGERRAGAAKSSPNEIHVRLPTEISELNHTSRVAGDQTCNKRTGLPLATWLAAYRCVSSRRRRFHLMQDHCTSRARAEFHRRRRSSAPRPLQHELPTRLAKSPLCPPPRRRHGRLPNFGQTEEKHPE